MEISGSPLTIPLATASSCIAALEAMTELGHASYWRDRLVLLWKWPGASSRVVGRFESSAG